MADEHLGEPEPYACEDCGRVYGSSSAALACCPEREDFTD